MKLGDFVKNYRKRHNNMSQRELASICGLSNALISMIEKGINPSTNQPITPTLPTLKKLVNGMQITLDELFEAVDDIDVSLDKNPFSDEEKADIAEIIELYNTLSDEDKANVKFYIRQLHK